MITEEVDICSGDCQGNEAKKQGGEVWMSGDSHDDKVSTGGEEGESKMVLKVDDSVIVLPEDLVERILAMVPFPHVFKARTLSKSWLARFSPIQSQNGEVEKLLAASFQKRVAEWSTKWKTLCPVFIDWQGFIAYDRASHSWPKLPSLSFLPHGFLSMSHMQIDGALLLVSEFYINWETATKEHKLLVANFLTRSWRRLPVPPPADETYLFEKLVTLTSLETYKVIVFYRGGGYCLAQIYDSKSNVWRSKTLDKDFSVLSRPTYLNGVLYMVVGRNPWNLLAFNVAEGTFEELEIFGDSMERFDADLVVCNATLLMVVKESRFAETVQVMKVDLEVLRLLKVAQGPPLALNFGKLDNRHDSDGECIFFPRWIFYNGMVVYNVQKNEWSHIPFPPRVTDAVSATRRVSAFQPNLNPFLAV